MKNGRLFWQQKNRSNISLNQQFYQESQNKTPVDKNQLRNWGLPEPILHHYGQKSISRFFDWQVECLELPGVLDDQKNLVYSAPTSAGKTMVADIVLFKTLLERRKKAIIILPFVSISVEKVQSLKQVFRRLGLRIDSFAGQTNPRGGLQRVDAAVCTIEKANNMVNRLIEEKKIAEIGLIIVDELHMIGDTSRGYILELLLSKLIHMKSNPFAEDIDLRQLQIIGMSATIPNLNDIAKWLDAEFFVTDYRPVPLNEHVVVGNEILKVSTNSIQPDTQFSSLQSTVVSSGLSNNDNNGEIECIPLKTIDCNLLKLNTAFSQSLIYMAIETLAQGFSTLIFCPTRSMCESMAKSIASNIFSIGQKDRIPQNDFERNIRNSIHSDQILSYQRSVSLINTLKRSSSGFDPNLERVLKFGCAFHHAGMTMEERGTVEQGFRDGTLRILCCTTTLSAGVNLPARRVMITSPLDYSNKLLAVGNYRQMIGRAGRKGIDTLGESFLFCADKDINMARRLISTKMQSIKSNLITIQKLNNNKSSATTSVEQIPTSSNIKWQPVLNDQLLRAVLEVIANEMVKNIDDIHVYLGCTFFRNCPLNLLGSQTNMEKDEIINECIRMVLDKLKTYEFIYIHSSEANNSEEKSDDSRINVTDLGRAVISSGVSPSDGQFIYEELKRFRTKLSLLTDLHLVYQTTPVYIINQLPDIDWHHYLNLYERWDKNTRHIAKLIGISEHFICIQVSTSGMKTSTQAQIHRRFYASLALFELIEEVPMWKVQQKYNLDKGILQSLQQQASTFAGMLSTFCQRLEWKTLAKLFEEFQPRLSFGVQLDLIDLVRIPCINSMIARQLHSKGYEDISSLIQLKPKDIEIALMTSKDLIPDGNNDPNEARIYLSTLDCTITIAELSKMIIKEARMLKEKEIGQKISFDNEIESGSTVNSPASIVNDDLPPPEQEKEQAFSKPTLKIQRSNESMDMMEPDGNNKRIKTDHSLTSNDYIEVPIEEDSSSGSSLPSSSTPNANKQPQSNSIQPSSPKSDTSTFFDDEDDDELLEGLSLIISKTKDDQGTNKTVMMPESSKSLSMSTMSIDEDIELLQMLEQQEQQDSSEDPESHSQSSSVNTIESKDEADRFLQSLADNEIINPPLLHESNVTVDNFELITIENGQSCQDFLARIFPENDNNQIVALYFRFEQRKNQNKQRTMIVLKPGDQCLSTQQQPSDEPLGFRLRNSSDLYLVGLYVTKLNQKQIYYINGHEALEFLRQNWFTHLSNVVLGTESTNTIRFVCHDVKQAVRCFYDVFNFDWTFISYRIEWNDATVATWLLDPESQQYNIDSIRIKDLPKWAMNHQLDIDYFNRIDKYRQILINTKRYPFGCQSLQDVDYLLKILILFNLVYGLLIRLREQNLYKSYRLIEIPSRICISVMESNPTKVDREYMNQLEDTIQDLISRIETKIFATVGRSFNLNSPDQIAKILYSQEMGLISSYFNVTTSSPGSSSKRLSTKTSLPKITPVTRKPSTSKMALMRLQESVGKKSHLPTMIIEWRRLNHALTNSIMTINRHWHLRNNDSFIYGNCCEWTATGRIAMYDPNLINLDNDFEIKSHLNDAIKNDDVKSTLIHIRRMIISPDNYELVTADYCQLELRILAHFSKDTNLVKVLNNIDVDVFKSIAASWKQISIDQVDYETRQQAKQICYGIIYGMGDESLAQKLEITREEAAEYKQSFFQRYNRLNEFITKTIDNCRQKRYVETIAGRRRQLSAIVSPKSVESSRACRQALNTKIQGSAADIIKIAMIAVQKQIDQQCFDVRFVLQMYDELMYQVRRDQLEQFGSCLKRQMEMVGNYLRVVLPVKISHGQNWSELEPLL
ncbi:dna polymerase theta-like protein [Dermatophagoides farinae]|nr:dna polymerase theta-like protein [Dermatophagoides farinae]